VGVCGRYTLTVSDPKRLAARFAFDESGVDSATLGRFDICPTAAWRSASTHGIRSCTAVND
jgi:hypothetical protein